MTEALGYLFIGVTVGSVYAALALALTLIYRSTGILNFAQGEMATITTFVVWQLLAWKLNIGLALLGGLVAAAALGWLIYYAVIRPLQSADEMSVLIATVGLFVGINAVTGLIWTTLIRQFDSPFGSNMVSLGTVSLSFNTIGTLGVLLVVVLLLFWLFSRTEVGLSLRAITANPSTAKLSGLRTNRYLAFGWGLAAMVGLVAGVLAAPVVSLQPQMMINTLIYAFAGAVLGGLTSPAGAVIGGLIVGMISTFAIGYFPEVGSTLNIAVPLFVIYAVLLIRPQGLFGRRPMERV